MSRLQKTLFESPQALLGLSFAGMIVLGSVLLALPVSHTEGSLGFLDALFTATSAVCVTGLAVADTGKDFTLFGQAVILVLIQTGGLGLMTFAGLVAFLLGKRLSLSSQSALSDSFLQRDAATQFRKVFFRILALTLTIEGVGAILLFVALLPGHSIAHAAGSALFHSTSAFCNAGFSIYSDSLVSFRNDPWILSIIMALILLGGTGHIVLSELWSWARSRLRREGKPLSYHARLVLGFSASLLAFGFVVFLLGGLGTDKPGFLQHSLDALFQSVTARTAGFNTINMGTLPLGSLVFMVLLMFIGGSPGSCAGGVKTTTVAIWLGRLRSRLLGRSDTVMFGRTIPVDIVRRVSVLMGLGILWNVLGLFLLAAFESNSGQGHLEALFFEQVSAFGTVGLSTGITASLGVVGKSWIILTMFIGRLGPLTLALWFLPTRNEAITYPDAKVMIG